MQTARMMGASIVALVLFVGVSGSALAGADSGGPMPVAAGKDGPMAPAAVVPAGAGPASAPAAPIGASKDTAGMAPAGAGPASVAGAPGRAGGVDPNLLGALLGGTGLLTLGSGLVWHRKRG